jgi:hypothetical protein
MKKRRNAKKYLEYLNKVPIVSSACEHAGISRNSAYRWRREDPVFAKEMDDALINGVRSVNDLAESKLIGLVQKSDIKAIQYWLGNNNKKYMRPRPNNFWDNFAGDKKVSGFSVHIVKTKDDLERLRRLEELEKKYSKYTKPEDDSFLLDNSD